MDDYQAIDSTEETSEDMPSPRRLLSKELTRNLVGFWIIGLCNNFAYVIMLSAAQDILEKHNDNATQSTCSKEIVERECTPMSTGSVLLADIIPSLFIKVTAPLFVHRIPFGIRHACVVVLQALSYLIVALSDNVPMALLGVALASFASGLGEISYLAFASHFKNDVISSWSSGTGGAGIFGALLYASLTDPQIVGLTPRNSLLLMLMIPIMFAFAYWRILLIPRSVYQVNFWNPWTYVVPTTVESSSQRLLDNETEESTVDYFNFGTLSAAEKCSEIAPLLKFMFPLILVYFGEYFINQGMFELTVFDCANGFSLSAASQYRWYQVLYQLGVFVSRSSSNYIAIAPRRLKFIAILQITNAVLFLVNAWKHVVPHITIIFIAIFYEGLLGGASYVNTFRAIHREVSVERREFALGFVSISDTFGVMAAGFAAMPAHNLICSLPW